MPPILRKSTLKQQTATLMTAGPRVAQCRRHRRRGPAIPIDRADASASLVFWLIRPSFRPATARGRQRSAGFSGATRRPRFGQAINGDFSWEGILSGAFPPGLVLRQEELSRRFGASRVPLREAMPRLEVEGLVVLRPRRGYAVRSLERSEIREIFELRAVVEEHLAGGGGVVTENSLSPVD